MGQAHRFLACFGNGFLGRLGLGPECRSEVFPRLLGTLVGYDMKQVECGGAHTASVSDDGTLFTFGNNHMGQLGHSSKDKFLPLPLEVGMPDPVTSVAAGEHHTLCMTSAGDVWAFGSNECGQLGIGAADDKRHVEPRLVKDLQGAKVVAVSAGSMHSLALTAQGEVLSWGQSDYGALGHGAGNVRQVQATPRAIAALSGTKVRSITSGFFSAGCIDDNGKPYTWGNGLYWQLGHGDPHHEYVPRKVDSINMCRSLAIGQMHGLACSSFDGTVTVWGTDDHGSLGQGDRNWQRIPVKQPKLVPGLLNVKSVTCGWKHSLAMTADGKLLTWGWNGAYQSDFTSDSGSGQLGHGEEKDKWAPVQIMRVKTNDQKFYDLRMPFLKPWKVIQASAGRNHTAAVIEAEVHMNDIQ